MKQSIKKVVFPLAIILHLVFRFIFSDGFDAKSVIEKSILFNSNAQIELNDTDFLNEKTDNKEIVKL